MSLIIIADTETTGIGPDAQVVEYAHLSCSVKDHGGFSQLHVEDEFESLVRPTISIPAGATKVHGITDEMVADSPDLGAVMNQRLPEKLGTLLIGHNFVRYDMKYLHYYVPKSYDVGCSLRLARQYLPQLKSHSLDNMRESLSLPTKGRAHRALGDVYTTLALCNHILQMGMPWQQLHIDSMQRVTTMPFGKHKGTPIADLPQDYVDWLLNSSDAVASDWGLRRALLER